MHPANDQECVERHTSRFFELVRILTVLDAELDVDAYVRSLLSEMRQASAGPETIQLSDPPGTARGDVATDSDGDFFDDLSSTTSSPPNDESDDSELLELFSLTRSPPTLPSVDSDDELHALFDTCSEQGSLDDLFD